MNKLAYALPIIAGILFGSVGVFVRALYGAEFNNATVIFARAVFAALMLLIYILIKDTDLLKIRKCDIPWILGCAIVGILAINVCFNISSTSLSLAFAAVLLSIAPIYTMVVSKLVFGTPITARKVICAALSIIGCILVSGVKNAFPGFSAAGIAAGIISGVCYGLYSIFSRKGTQGGLNAITITFYSMLILTIVLAPFSDFCVIASYICIKPVAHIGFLLLHSLCVAVLPYLFITHAVRFISPAAVTILASCEPVAAMIFGVLFFNESPTVLAILGIVVVVVALGLLCTDKSNR